MSQHQPLKFLEMAALQMMLLSRLQGLIRPCLRLAAQPQQVSS
jgi:hypothetical protein